MGESIMMPKLARVVLLAGASTFLLTGSSCPTPEPPAAARAAAQDEPPYSLIAHHATMSQHGVGKMSGEVRQWLASSKTAVDVYAALLERRRNDVTWDAYTVLWWLAESGESRFVPMFLSRSSARTPREASDVYAVAVYGLARNAAEVPEAFARLREILLRGSIEERAVAGNALAYVNDDTAQGLLRSAASDAFGPIAGPRVALVLSGPPLARGRGRWPCGLDEQLGRGAGGAYQCVPAPPER